MLVVSILIACAICAVYIYCWNQLRQMYKLPETYEAMFTMFIFTLAFMLAAMVILIFQ